MANFEIAHFQSNVWNCTNCQSTDITTAGTPGSTQKKTIDFSRIQCTFEIISLEHLQNKRPCGDPGVKNIIVSMKPKFLLSDFTDLN